MLNLLNISQLKFDSDSVVPSNYVSLGVVDLTNRNAKGAVCLGVTFFQGSVVLPFAIPPFNKNRSVKSEVMAPSCLSLISGRREEVKG